MPGENLDDELYAMVDEARASAGTPALPGTLHGVDSVAVPDVIIWAPDERAAAAIREAGYPQ